MIAFFRWAYDNLIETLVGVILGIIVLLTFYQVVARYAFASPLNWLEEFAQLLLVWAVMLGAAAAVKRSSHLTVDILFNQLRGVARVVAVLVINGLVMFLAIGMAYYGYLFYLKTAGDYATSLGFARNLFYLPVPIAGVLIAVFLVPATVQTLRLGDAHRNASDDSATID